VSRWDLLATLSNSRLWYPGRPHGTLYGYAVCSWTGDTQFSPVFATRGLANAWLHEKYEHTERHGRKHQQVVTSYPCPVHIVRVEQ
jgi:hypothetical protein